MLKSHLVSWNSQKKKIRKVLQDSSWILAVFLGFFQVFIQGILPKRFWDFSRNLFCSFLMEILLNVKNLQVKILLGSLTMFFLEIFPHILLNFHLVIVLEINLKSWMERLEKLFSNEWSICTRKQIPEETTEGKKEGYSARISKFPWILKRAQDDLLKNSSYFWINIWRNPTRNSIKKSQYTSIWADLVWEVGVHN